ncbi:1,5-anhydro-D-fructose reductase-like [Pollicipes pollicipes]|uniref:1,5-anhydro-D-fructose reductase-like n=1 Tax=Pollicipes pollicipes TaxID=41117 RepID=UPI0018858A50|nr:1,5-anhydro-D-fructose reductase-like [Pollicipes pollicipes]
MTSKGDKNLGSSDKELAVKAKTEFNKGNYSNCLQAKLRPERLETLEDVDNCILYYNYAVILYHLRQYRAALGIVSKIFRYIEPLVAPRPARTEEAPPRTMNTSVTLSSGQRMPLLGLGCSRASSQEVADAVETALLAGYRHIDTAYFYRNEDGVGEGIQAALKSGKMTRSDLFVVTKLPMIAMQVECHVYFQQRALREACKKHNIAITAYAPLGSPGRKVLYESHGVTLEPPDLLNNPVVCLVAQKHKRTAAQVLLRFLAQQDIIVIPKSTKATRIRENGDIFSFQLDELDMAALSSLDQGEPGRTFRMHMFPGVSDHPEAPF